MSGDEHISKLFTDNEYKLDEMPSSDLWSRIESKLDVSMPGESTETASGTSLKVNHRNTGGGRGSGMLRMLPYASAAAILVALLCLPFLFRNNNEGTTTSGSEQFAVNHLSEPVEVPLDPEPEPLMDSAGQIQLFQEQEDAQSTKIEKLVEKTVKTTPAVKPADVKLKENDNSIITIVNEPVVEEPKAVLSIAATNTTNQSNSNNNIREMQYTYTLDEWKNEGQNYANTRGADISKSDEIKKEIAQNYAANDMTIKGGSKDGPVSENYNSPIQNRAARKDKQADNKTSDVVPQLQIFDWMLGEWIDKDVEGGESHEIWKRVDRFTIECNGYMLKNKGKEKIFEEKLIIYYDPALNQVFLKMPVDDSRQYALYMLIKYDTDRFIYFEQNSNKTLPDQVIFERDFKGYKVIINNRGGMLEDNQQNYLKNRNRVTNVTANRVLQPAKRK